MSRVRPPATRIGLGYDLHRLKVGRPLVLGGVQIEAQAGFDTPSDGDVLCHALIDALAGALAEGDLGRYFPADSDPAAQGARSLEYVAGMTDHLQAAGVEVAHIDSYITLGTTRLAPHLDAMADNIATALRVARARISVKARTNDGLGPEGQGQAASANVAVLLVDARMPV
jgi:2-C-methyl-D-erythritol 2,4-cyclodiphosphate synthase